ncbi:LLM class F420-dependent oxidoreductase [Ktedonobacter sp. SOSP1-52]|uniref:TIGR03560 family F420-dependent LLM class oxidoreductase n=1 Tax=Ktedonobacter sp. SOSP1-52 TaxID=2778366 RepID=UPI0019154B6C|nr:TIGR03560 family F420-dependent LLM class oxidoreductase [Ktedonobacter sp. SOSP1-52]GHO64971.1 LLM class F420-dependent oxidoreductase [Ktedonobacter sp. SOSP1-52]
MSMKFSVILPNGATNELAGIKDPVEAYETMTRTAQIAEGAGFDALWVSDVLWPGDFSGRDASQEFLFECWSTMAALARDTSHARIGQIVTSNVFRHPALLAKMASTIDVMSHGRLTLGIGSGSPAIASQARAYGYDYADVPVRSRQLREAIQIILAMWTQEEATFEGKFYSVQGAINQPKGVQRPHIPLLIAGNGEQVTLKLVAQYGNACNIHGNPATLKNKFAVLKEHCETVGRDYQSIHRTSGSYCILEETDEQALAKAPESVQTVFGNAALIGSPATIRERIAAYEDAGVQELLLRFPGTGQQDAIRRFAEEFIG